MSTRCCRISRRATHLSALVLLGLSGLAAAAESGSIEISGPDSPAPESPGVFANLRRDADAFTLVSETRRLSFHKPMYLLPATWSSDFRNDETEVLFQISLKQRLFNRNFFFGYTQRSFWQLYNGNESRPFRDTNYNPELFYRWKPHWESAPGLGFDIGVDHESNGKSLPDSRSWNRVIGAVYYESPLQLLHLRLWYRVPEDEDRAEDDPKRDDNPDITDYYGYGELRIQRKLFGPAKHQASLMLRGNPATGKGAVQLVYSAPFTDDTFWNVYFWHGYGEGLLDYNRSVTRIGVGFMLAR